LSAAPAAALTILSFLGAARAQAQEPASLPEGNAYVRSLLAEQRKQDEAINDFTYDLEETRENLNKKGLVTSTTSLHYEVYFVKTRQVRRLISKNGVPLSQKEQAAVDKKAAERARDIREGRTVTELVGVRLSNLFSSFDFKTLSRTEVDGRPVVELEFRPLADRPRESEGVGVNDRVLKMLSGRVTIDELDQRVVRLEARSDEHLSASVAPGVKLGTIDFSVEFLRLGDKLWLPRKIVTYATGRAFLFVTFRVRQTSTYSSYHSFKVDTEERAVRP
jgi:hypothetical protein